MAEANPATSKQAVFFRRTLSTVSLWAVVAAAFASRMNWAYVALVGVLTLLAMIEFFQMLKAGAVKSFPRYGMLLGIGYSAAVYWHLIRAPHGGGIEVPTVIDLAGIFLALAGSFTLQLRHPLRGMEGLQAVASSVLGFVYIPLLFSFAARVVFIVPLGQQTEGWAQVPGAMVLLWMIAVTKFTDMGAYITGSLFGKHKMIPHVSPGKTWEGFVGALFFSQLAGCGLYALCPAGLAVLGGWPQVIVLGLVLSLLAVVGDLAESVIKRCLGAKDSGKMLPGIGGSLDLIDSLCFTAPALYFYLSWVLK
jgi:phosphatidate cytidylyltransferase